MFSKYIFILAWIGIMALLQSYFTIKKVNNIGSNIKINSNDSRVIKSFALIVVLPIIIMATTRGNIGDTYMYVQNYLEMPSSLSEFLPYISTLNKDIGFSVLSLIVHYLIGNQEIIYLFIIAALQGYAISKLYRIYSCDYVFSIFLFIASTDYLSWMFNGIRQFLAVSIIIFVTPLMIKKAQRPLVEKYIPILLVILLASTIHQSALLMIPFVLIAQGDAWNIKTISFVILALAAVAFVGSFTNLLDKMLASSQYVNVVSDYKAFNDDGTNPLRVAVYSIPAILSFIFRSNIRKSENPIINFSANMSIISMGLYLISMVTSGIFMGRLPIYCSLYEYILLPWIFNNCFELKTKKIVKFLSVILYIVFYLYQLKSWGNI